jgi:hypothetical protein
MSIVRTYVYPFFMHIYREAYGTRLFITSSPDSNNNMQKRYAKCSACQAFANIHCINCINIWLCIDHWQGHRADTHQCSI